LSQDKKEDGSRTYATMVGTEVEGRYLTVSAAVYNMEDCSATSFLEATTKSGLGRQYRTQNLFN
jgi:hypothetical protein